MEPAGLTDRGLRDIVEPAGLTDRGLRDIVEIEQLLARYASAMTRNCIEEVMAVFTADGVYSAFGETYTLSDFPALVEAAPKGLFLCGTPAIELDGDEATGTQPLSFIAQEDHHLRIGWYTDRYRRTEAGWRLAARSMTFLRRSGARDSGRPHDPARPAPGGAA